MYGGTFGGTTSYSERTKYILKYGLYIIIVAFQAAQITLFYFILFSFAN
jgi:hypothetical protein